LLALSQSGFRLRFGFLRSGAGEEIVLKVGAPASFSDLTEGRSILITAGPSAVASRG
jgi:hypothetical protein